MCDCGVRVRTLFFILILLSSSPAAWGELPSSDRGQGKERLSIPDQAERLLSMMSDEELLGQVYIIGYHGEAPTAEIMNWITERQLGGVKIFTRNVKSLKGLTKSIYAMQSAALAGKYKIPLFIATDQEGGWVRHVQIGTSVSPGNMALGAGGLPQESYQTGYYLGKELRTLGINMNFAPTVDIYATETSAVIGPRAFSADPLQVSMFALAYFKGMNQAGVICVAKHFPGHGAADKDSHGFLPHIITDFDTLWEKDLLPYRILIKEGLPAVMSGHLSFPRIVPDNQPATLSSFFLQKILRDKLNFQGVTITDDMEMQGVLKGDSIPEATAKALLAGNDLILVSHTPAFQEECWQYHLKLLKTEAAFRKRIKESVKRILQLKFSRLRQNFPLLPDPKKIENELPLPEAKSFFFDSTCRAITVIKNKYIPYRPAATEKILLIGQSENFFTVGKEQFPKADQYSYAFFPIEWSNPKDVDAVKKMAPRYNTIIFCLVSWNSLEVLNALEDFKGKLIVISSLSPIYLREAPWVQSALAVYNLEKDSFRAGFRALAGDFKPEGVLPISLE